MATGVLALDIGATKIAAAVGDSDGQLRHVNSAQTLARDGAESVLDRAIALARGCYEAELEAGGSIEAFGVSTMGLTFETHVELAPNVPGWSQLQIRSAIRTAFPELSVTIGNDVKVATRAELAWGALRGVDDGVYLNLGSGISAGIVSGGRLLTGAHGAFGEVGYSLFRGGPEQPAAADGVAPFEEWFGGTGAGRRLEALGFAESVKQAAERQAKDPAARAFVEDLWSGIAVMAANLCVMVDPAVLCLGGGYVRGTSEVLERVSSTVARVVPYAPKVVRAYFGGDAALRGAIALALSLPRVSA